MPGQVRPVTDERSGLLAFLAQQRLVLRIAAYGLTEDQLRAAPTASSLTVGGLIKHCIDVERGWIDRVKQVTVDADADGKTRDYLDNFRMRPEDRLEDLLSQLDEVAAETERVVDAGDLGDPVPVPRDAPWFPDDIEAWSVRWVLLHLISEHARHAGHADIIREAIDGATAFPLMAAAEGWPATPWMQPWQPDPTAVPGGR
jgi:uncharacterized damage-inducible protein DinB